MKTTVGNIWYEKVGHKYQIGFTRDCIEQKLVETFHILPADNYAVKAKGPLMVLETNDGLEAVNSPVAGKVVFFNDKARNFPDKLTTEDVIIEVEVPHVEVKKEPAKKTPTTTKIVGGNQQQVFNLNWDNAGIDIDDWLR